MRVHKLAAILALITLLTGLGAATGELKIVTKDENTETIENVNITVEAETGDTERQKETGASGEARFVDLPSGDYVVNLSHRLYTSREITVSVEDNTQTTKTIILDRKERDGTLKVHVKDYRGNNLGGAEVQIVAQERDISRTKETTSNGIASFTTRIGTYDVYINHPAHRASHVTVEVRAEQTVEKTVQLFQSDGGRSGEDLEISQIIVPSRIKKGSNVEVSFKVRNLGDTRMKSIEARMTAFGQTKTTDNFAIDAGGSKWMLMNVSVPMEASGPERIQIEVQNPEDRDVEFITTTVSDLTAYMDLSPSPATSSQPVLVTGRIIHTGDVAGAADVSANLYLGGSFIAGVTTDETGRYSTYVYPPSPGSYTVTLRNSYFSASKTLHVRPGLTIESVTAPSRVNRTDVTDICGQIESRSQLNVNAVLQIDGSTVGSRNVNVDGQKRICFTLPTATKGEHTAQFAVSTGSYTRSQEHSYTVVRQQRQPVRLDAPRSVDLIQHKHGLIQVNITNQGNQSRNVTVSITGLDDEYSQQASLRARSQTQITFNVSEVSSGTYTPSITVKDGNKTLASGSMSLEVQTEKQSILNRAGRQVARVAELLPAPNLNYLIAALILAAVIYVLVRSNTTTPSSLEPRQR